MTLPRLLLVTDRHQMRPSFTGALEAALRGGARLIQLREKTLSPREVFTLALQTQPLVERFGAHLLINSRADIARAVHAAGVHLPEDDIAPAEARLSLSQYSLCGASVHSVEAAQRATAEGADYLVFGPVFPTASHPTTAPAGIEKLTAVVRATPRPVYAIGGVTDISARQCREAGAYGIAVMSAVWQAENVANAVRALNSALG